MLGHALAAFALVLIPKLATAGAPSLFIENLTWPEVRAAIEAGRDTALIYAGSTEQNGPHLALGKHNFIARHLAERIAAELGNALVYPIVPFAPTGDPDRRTGHMRFPGSVSVTGKTFATLARELALSARAAGFRHVVLMGDHGDGQETLARVAAELDRQWRAAGDRCHYAGDVYFAAARQAHRYLASQGIDGDGHAGVADTAELMAIDRDGRWLRREALGGRAPEAGVEGDPRRATAEIGRALLDLKARSAVVQIRSLVGRKP